MTLDDFEQIKENLISDFDNFWTPSILKSELLGDNRIYLVAKEKNEIMGIAGMLLGVDVIEVMNIVAKKTERNKRNRKFIT